MANIAWLAYAWPAIWAPTVELQNKMLCRQSVREKWNEKNPDITIGCLPNELVRGPLPLPFFQILFLFFSFSLLFLLKSQESSTFYRHHFAYAKNFRVIACVFRHMEPTCLKTIQQNFLSQNYSLRLRMC